MTANSSEGDTGDTVLMTGYREVFVGLEGAEATLGGGGVTISLFLLHRDVRDEVLEHGESPRSLLCTPNGGGVAQKPPRSPQPPLSPPELTVADRRQKREIRQLEQELHKWQVLVDSITGERRGACVRLSSPPSVCPVTLFLHTPQA